MNNGDTGARSSNKFIYLYYLTTNHEDDEKHTRVFVVERSFSGAKDEIKSLVDDVKTCTIKPCGWSIGDVKWRRKAYLVFVLEDDDEEITSVTFDKKYTIDPGKLVTIQSTGSKITAYYCYNKMKKKNGKDNVDSTPDYVKVKVIHSNKTEEERTHADTGTNLGPPVGGGG